MVGMMMSPNAAPCGMFKAGMTPLQGTQVPMAASATSERGFMRSEPAVQCVHVHVMSHHQQITSAAASTRSAFFITGRVLEAAKSTPLLHAMPVSHQQLTPHSSTPSDTSLAQALTPARRCLGIPNEVVHAALVRHGGCISQSRGLGGHQLLEATGHASSHEHPVGRGRSNASEYLVHSLILTMCHWCGEQW